MLADMKIIAHIHNDYVSKFGIPRQSGIGKGVLSEIVFEKEYQIPEAFRGIEEYSHLWLIWQFSEAVAADFRPTVRPPRLGGNKRMGVFATRSPFRPNPIGLSCVKLEEVKKDDKNGVVLVVSGADLKCGTPIYDIKPYLAYADSYPEAVCGFADDVASYRLEVDFPDNLLCKIEPQRQSDVIEILANDPRPSYHKDKEREYGFEFGSYEIKFKADEKNIHVTDVICQK
ncbi:MAG: tRNA (N6-threonylcarbamoyladenosine(37)-N6)-methyltransferase TrmO [Clostridia bacterium]|nr:tRNA (N6-threonylcarbamoyladenosine(37)-N6)-methyltransferase TrmO [Clostridia bacterium]